MYVIYFQGIYSGVTIGFAAVSIIMGRIGEDNFLQPFSDPLYHLE